MEKNDLNLRKLNPSQLFSLRKQVVRLKKSNSSMEFITEITSLNKRQVNKIWAAYLTAGEDIAKLRPQFCGRRKGSGVLLAEGESQSLRAILTQSTPEQYDLGQLLWTRECVIRFIQKTCGKHVPARSVTNYLKQWNLSLPSTALPQGFSEDEYRKLQRRAKNEHAVLYLLRASNISKAAYFEMAQELGRTSILHVPAEKPIDAIYAVPSKGAIRFLVVGDKDKSMRQIDFLRRLLADTHNAKCILILDNLVLDRGARMR